METGQVIPKKVKSLVKLAKIDGPSMYTSRVDNEEY